MFRIHALPAEPFSPLTTLDTAALAAERATRVTADRTPGFPCRVSLEDAEPGESLLLLHFTHHDVDSPYRAAGPIFVREAAMQAQPAIGEVPLQLRRRLLSVRGYDAPGENMLQAEVLEGERLADTLTTMFANPDIAYVHIHIARPGCFAARATRA